MAGVWAVARSQVTSGLAGSERCCLSCAGLSQSSASNCFWMSAVIQLESLAFAGFAVGLGSFAAGVRDSAEQPRRVR